MTTAGVGLVHAAVVGEDPEDVVRLCLPTVEAALEAGGEVEIVLDRRGTRAFREVLPDAALRLPAPTDVVPTTLAHRLGATMRATRGVVIGRSCADAPDDDRDLAEAALTLLLADHPLSVFCVYAPGQVDLARRSHPWVLTPDGPVPSPDHRPPNASSPVPAAVLGASVATVPVPDGAALADLRARFAAIVHEAGLAGERADAAVLAAHEAMLLACGADLSPGHPPGDLPPGAHLLDVRRSAGAVIAECRGRPTAPPRASGQDTRLSQLAHLCDHATVHDDADGRTVRVLTGTR
ncbi:hypothetical protein [Actinomycetospora termitidis]|uniref:Uncharacterized protein n=1 Tax=Actinomycetospora termitidis TaxID=3053470 RepID=A0ABT7MER3_9PSEU|nr:hypothetical protein [Actinomycetospora sp. Odt1-22]MDL5159158.1 hypothetical protein [Actinomycetospora sp. Odt1-22]